jgi:uncharacterized protein YqhQ
MDLKRIFIKDACPTKMGGQAVLEGIMMRGESKNAVAVRLPDDSIHLKVEKNSKAGRLKNIPFIRGVFVFISSLVQGTKTLMYSADVLEESYAADDTQDGEESRVYGFLERKLGERGAWNLMLYFSVAIAVVFSVAVFILGPTVVVNVLKHATHNAVLLNLAEGVFRILLFILYIWIVSKMEDMKRLFQYHGAEHKTIHCYENGLPLTAENAQGFYTLHPRCGTSFLMFVMVVSLIVFSFLGWPNLLWRIVSRILLLPVVAGLSYELLRWAGRSDNIVVRILSVPGLLLQKLTTGEPDLKQLEVAIAATEAVLSEEDNLGKSIIKTERSKT